MRIMDILHAAARDRARARIRCFSTIQCNLELTFTRHTIHIHRSIEAQSQRRYIQFFFFVSFRNNLLQSDE